MLSLLHVATSQGPLDPLLLFHPLVHSSHYHLMCFTHALQALRNEDDYEKFASDTNRSHVTVSAPGSRNQLLLSPTQCSICRHCRVARSSSCLRTAKVPVYVNVVLSNASLF